MNRTFRERVSFGARVSREHQTVVEDREPLARRRQRLDDEIRRADVRERELLVLRLAQPDALERHRVRLHLERRHERAAVERDRRLRRGGVVARHDEDAVVPDVQRRVVDDDVERCVGLDRLGLRERDRERRGRLDAHACHVEGRVAAVPDGHDLGDDLAFSYASCELDPRGDLDHFGPSELSGGFG